MNQLIQISNYFIDTQQLLGKGSFGMVYACTNEKYKDKHLCAKVIACRVAAMQVQKEISVLHVLQKISNPNLIQIYDILQDKANLYIIMDRCRGGDLKQLIMDFTIKKKQFPLEQIIDMIRQIVLGYKALIEQKIIHRDLKPANILYEITQQNQITLKLTDFGLGKNLNDIYIQQYMTRVGTPIYMSPQIVFGEKYSSKCDIFSLGIIIYELAFLEIPQEGYDMCVRNSFQNSLRKKKFVCPELPQKQPAYLRISIQNLINAMLSLEEEKRPSWDDVLKLEFMNTVKFAAPNQLFQKLKENLFNSIHRYQGSDRFCNMVKSTKIKELKQKFKSKNELLRKPILLLNLIIIKAQLALNLQQQLLIVLEQKFPDFDKYHFHLIVASLIGYRYKILQNAIGFWDQKNDLMNVVFKKILGAELGQIISQFQDSKQDDIIEMKESVEKFFIQSQNIFKVAENDLIQQKAEQPINKIEKFYELINKERRNEFEVYRNWFRHFWILYLRKLLTNDQQSLNDINYCQLLILIDKFLNQDKDYSFEKCEIIDDSKILLEEEITNEELKKQINLRVYV